MIWWVLNLATGLKKYVTTFDKNTLKNLKCESRILIFEIFMIYSGPLLYRNIRHYFNERLTKLI